MSDATHRNCIVAICLVFILNLPRLFAHVDSEKLLEECKIADICRHDQVAICAIDSCGEMRTFIDNCDLHEYNCDAKKDYVQKPLHECWVTCKRGRSFKKPTHAQGCDAKQDSIRLNVIR